MKKKIITIVGGGSSAHALIPFINSQHREINILTSRPNEWNKKVKVQWQNSQGNVIKAFTGNLSNKYSHPKYIIPNSDIIIFCMPVHKYRIALNNIAKFINKEKDVTIGTMYGQGGFNWMVKEIKQKFKLKRITTFAIGLIPWVCRIKEYGKIGITYGPKSLNIVTFDNIERFYTFEDIFHDMCYKWFGKGMFKISNNFISLTLSVDNQIIHPSRLFAMYQKNKGKWDNKDDVPLFYKDYDDYSAEILKVLDDDYSSIRKKIIEFYKEHNFKYMLDYLSLERLSYNSANQNIKESFVSSQTLGTIKTPVIKKIINGKLTQIIDFFMMIFTMDYASQNGLPQVLK